MSEVKQKYSAKLQLILGFAALVILVVFFGAWSLGTKISGAIIASGIIEVEANRQVVEHPEGGVVSEILVTDGASVKAGDPLVHLDSELLQSELQIIEAQYFELLARRARLEAEREGAEEIKLSDELQAAIKEQANLTDLVDGQTRLLNARLENTRSELEQHDTQILQLERQINGSKAQLIALQKQAGLIERERADSQTLLDKGLSQASRTLSLEREAARLEGSVAELDARASQLAAQIAEIEITKLRLTSQRQEQAITELRDIEPRILELAERRLSLSTRLNRLTLRAPMNGVIYGSTIFTNNSVISGAEPVMYIVPQSQPLVIKARVESIHIDQIFKGQKASLRFPSFDQRLTPEIFGKVLDVSADVFTDEATGAQFYQATLEPDETELVKFGGQVLLPGMPVEAYIATGERSPMSYLVKPLSDYFVKAFRED